MSFLHQRRHLYVQRIGEQLKRANCDVQFPCFQAAYIGLIQSDTRRQLFLR